MTVQPTPPELDAHRHRKDWRDIAERWPDQAWSSDAVLALPDALTRAEARADIRGRAVAIYRERARQAEAERDEWRQTALDERGAALDLLEQIKVRDRRIQAVQHLVDQADHAGDWTVTCTHLQRAIDE